MVISIADKVPLKRGTKRILDTIKKYKRNDENRILLRLLSLLPQPNPRIDKFVLAQAYIQKLRSEITELSKKQDELLALERNCNCSARQIIDERKLVSKELSNCDSDSISDVVQESPPTILTNLRDMSQSDVEANKVQLVYSQGCIDVTITAARSSKSMFSEILRVIQSHDAEVLQASLNKQDQVSIYHVHAEVADAEKFSEKELLSALENLAIST